MHKKSVASTQLGRDVCHAALQNRHATQHRFFLIYAFDLFRRARFYTVIRDLLSYLRRFRTVTLLLKILSLLFAILQTGTLVILSTVIFLVLLPILIALMLGILLTARIESRKSNRLMAEQLREKHVYVLFLSKRESTFFKANAMDLAKRDGCAVIVVSPYWISGRGLNDNRFFCTVRREEKSLYLVRRYYFFTLKNRVLDQKNTAYIF